MQQKICVAAGLITLLCAAAPLFYRVWNFGVFTLFCLAIFFFTLPGVWRWLGGFEKLRALFGTLVLVGGLYFISVSAVMAYKAWMDAPPKTGRVQVVVLGAQITGTHPSLMLKRRLDVAAEYLAGNPESVCIVTGGQGANEELPEAHVMAAYLEAAGIAPERIRREDASTNTRENFRFAAPFLEEGAPVLIVTDSFHQMRASIFAEKEFADKNPVRLDALSSHTPWGLFPAFWTRDLCGISVAWLQVTFGT